MSDMDSQELSEKRTEWSEDRTVLANERNFGSWMRTGFASVGVGIGMQAVFGPAEPTWLAKLGATLFIGLGIFIFLVSWHRSRKVVFRLDAHSVEPAGHHHMTLIAWLFSLAAVMLLIILWRI